MKSRVQAELCVALLKRYGNPTQIGTGQITYANLKSESDAAIAGLITALATGGAPDSLGGIQSKISSTVLGLGEFCDSVKNIISVQPGERGVWSELAKAIPIETLIKLIADGVATLYNNHRDDTTLMRKVIRDQLEAAKWPDFTKVDPAP
jgi:hypothetical protein